MSAWYMVLNDTKKEYIFGPSCGYGAQLLCQVGDEHGSLGDLLYLLLAHEPEQSFGGADKLLGRWAGDAIRVINDYSPPDDLTGGESLNEGYTDISATVKPLGRALKRALAELKE